MRYWGRSSFSVQVIGSQRTACPEPPAYPWATGSNAPSTFRQSTRSNSPDSVTSSPLTRLPGVHAYSLQKGDAGPATDMPVADAGLTDLTPEWRDFADSAAMIEALDLVITVDTAIAHLAGALGRPVWILLPPNADWRWLLGRDDSPWYPTARLFRRDFGEPRAAQVARVVEALKALDDVAYVRFASVYRDFRQTEDFARFLSEQGLADDDKEG